eukprot:UN04322
MFYRFLCDSKKRKIWSDTRNKAPFKKYLYLQLSYPHRYLVVMYPIDSKRTISIPKNKKSHGQTGKNQKNKNDTISSLRGNVVGKDNKGRTLYKGKRGGIFYLTASGNKVYVKKPLILKKKDSLNGNVVGKDNKGRTLYTGKKQQAIRTFQLFLMILLILFVISYLLH